MTHFRTATRIFVLLALTITFAPGLQAQQVTRINPAHITFRGVSLSSLWTGIIVGDSNYVAITHHAYDVNDTPSFTALQSPFAHSTMLDAVAYAGDTSHAVIAGEKGSLAWTSDDGATWHIVSSLNTSATIRAVTWNKSTATPVLVAVGDGGFVARSTDQGQTWQTITLPTSAQLNAIDFGTASDAVAVGNDTTMIQSHDGGQTWSTMPFPYDFHTWYGGQYENVMGVINFSAVAMNGADSVYVAFDTAMVPLLVYKGTTADTSQAWYHRVMVVNGDVPERYLSSDGSSIDSVWPHYTSLFYVGMPNVLGPFNGTTYPLTLSTYGTTSNDYDFRMAGLDSLLGGGPAGLIGDADGSTDYVTMRLRASAFWQQDTNLVIMMVGDECSVYKRIVTPSTGYNSSLTRHVLPFPSKLNREDFLAVSTLPGGIGYEVSVGPTLQKTIDSGRTWADLSLPIADQQDSSINNLYVLDSATVLTVGWSGIIMRYDPLGFHFLPSGTTERLESIAFPSHDTGIIVGDFGTVLQSSDRGGTWKAITSIPTTERLYSVAFTNNKIGIATGDSATILRTTDEGLTWSNVNNLVTGTPIPIRKVQVFPNGLFLAQAGNQLLRSTDFGQNWISILPPNMSDTSGMSFYSPQIGMIAARSTSTAIAPDTAHLAYTTDGGVIWTPFSFPFWNYNRVVFNWLSDHEAIIYGVFGFIDDVVISTSGVRMTPMDNTSAIQLFPNPSSGNVTVSSSTKTNGLVTIELWDEAGKRVAQLFSGEESAGLHEQSFTIPSALHGAFFIRLYADGATSATKLNIQ